MTAARVLTVGAAYLGADDDASGREVVRALLAEGLPVASREVVDEDEAALDALLRAPFPSVRLTVVLARAGGSAGEIVRRVLARITGTRLVLSERLLGLLEEDFARRGQAMPRRQDRLALLPQGAQVWPARAGEPGWAMETPQGLVAVLPLGSAHLGDLVDGHVRPAARAGLGAGGVSLLRTLKTAGPSATAVEERLDRWLGKEGDVQVACLPAQGEVWVRLLARAASRQLAGAALAQVEPGVRQALGTDCYGVDQDSLEAVVGGLLVERGLTVAVAESCTGGLLAHRLTGVAGASRHFERGVVVYSNQAKEDLLGVPGALLRAHGAVSAPVAEAMAAGICRVSRSACGLAITGIAGPGAGSAEKPVGTVWVGAASPAGVEARRFRFGGDREAVKWQATQAALDLLRRALLAERPAPL
jgi:nicotinamide-nucleotide amidase